MRTILYSLTTVSLAFMLSCQRYPTDDVTTAQQDVVTTYYSKEANFNDFKTYAISDSILYISVDAKGDTVSKLVSPELSEFLISSISDNMDSRNYKQVGRYENPDLAIDVTVADITNVQVYYWSTMWGGYWGCYYCYYGYPWYWTSVYTYKTGTLMMVMTDRKNIGTDNKINVIWNGLLDGYISDTKSYNKSRVSFGINEAFTISPYLQTSK